MQNSLIWNASIFRLKESYMLCLFSIRSEAFSRTSLRMPSFKPPATYLGILAFSCARVRAKFHIR